MIHLPESRRWRVVLTVALFVVLAAGLFVRLGHDRVYPKSEARCFGVVADMMRTGDWLVPHFGGQIRLQKPPLFYWAAATVASVAGEHSLLTLRSVSAASALGLALAVFAVGVSLNGFAAGFWSAAALGASAIFFIRGRVGDAEMLLALLTFLSLAAFERLWFRGDRRMEPALAIFVGLGFLTKATAALLSVLAPILVWLAVNRSLRLVLRARTLLWSSVAALIGLSWYWIILVRLPEARELFREFLLSPFGFRPAHVDETQHHDATHVEAIYYYLARFPLQLLPASVLLIPLGWEAWCQHLWRDEPRVRFYALAFVVQFVGWSLVPGKQLHYLLPLVPLFAVVAGHWLAKRTVEGRRVAPRQ